MRKCNLYRDTEGRWRWRLKARNGRIIADSGQGYRRAIDAEAAFESIVDMTHTDYEWVEE